MSHTTPAEMRRNAIASMAAAKLDEMASASAGLPFPGLASNHPDNIIDPESDIPEMKQIINHRAVTGLGRG